MKKLTLLFAALLCTTASLFADESGPIVVTVSGLQDNIGKEVQLDDCQDFMGMGALEAGQDCYLYQNNRPFIINPIDALDGAAVPSYPETFSVIGIVKEGSEMGVYVEATQLIVPPTVTIALGSDAPDVVYLGETASYTAVKVYGSNLEGETLTFALSSDTDTEAEYRFPNGSSLSVESVSTFEGASFAFTITPKELSPTIIEVDPWFGRETEVTQTKYYLTISLDGVEFAKDSIIFEVKPAAPEFELSVASSPTSYDDVYKGETYDVTFNLTGNKFVTGDVELVPAADCGLVLDKTSFTAAEVTAQYGAEVTGTITPPTYSPDDETYIEFPFTIKTGDTDTTVVLFKYIVLDNAPLLKFGSGILMGDTYATAQTSKKILVSGNPYITEDVEFTAIHDDIDSIVPAKLTAAEIKEGEFITVYVTPKTASDTRVDFTFSATSSEIDTTYYVYASKVLAPEAKLTIQERVTDNSNVARIGSKFTKTVTISGNPFVTKPVTVTAKSAEITNISHTTIPAADLAGKSVTITVEFTPTTASNLDAWSDPELRDFAIEYTSEELEESAKTTFQFGVLPPAEFKFEVTSDNVEYSMVSATAGKETIVTLTASGVGLTNSVFVTASAKNNQGTPATTCTLNTPTGFLGYPDLNKDGYDLELTFKADEIGSYTCTITAESMGDFDEIVTLTLYFIVEEGTLSALENVETEVKAVKVMENGQIFILKDGVKYNVLGAIVK